MNRFDLRGYDEAKMAARIDDGRHNSAILAEAADPTAALGELLERANLVWAVWPETDKRKAKLLGHSLAIIKGIPLMARIVDRRITTAELEESTVMFESHADACMASARFGDDRRDAA